MKLIIAEKNDAARQIAERLSTGKPKKDKVYNTAIYRFCLLYTSDAADD